MKPTPPEQRLTRLITAARRLALLGSIEGDVFTVDADLGRELRAAIRAYDHGTLGEVQELLRERTVGG